MNEKFWGSPTEKELREVAFTLIDLGYTVEPTPMQVEEAKIIAKKFGFELPPED